MRVIGGVHRGRRLRAPEGFATRPTADKVRESLFNILQGRVGGARFLDAFAGTGAVGIEALSRGAAEAVFVEPDRAARRLLEANLADLGLPARILPEPFAAAAERLGREGAAFDLVYLDPPYGPGEVDRALQLVTAHRLLAGGGLLVAETDARLGLPDAEGDLRRIREVRYGRTRLGFFARG